MNGVKVVVGALDVAVDHIRRYLKRGGIPRQKTTAGGIFVGKIVAQAGKLVCPRNRWRGVKKKNATRRVACTG